MSQHTFEALQQAIAAHFADEYPEDNEGPPLLGDWALIAHVTDDAGDQGYFTEDSRYPKPAPEHMIRGLHATALRTLEDPDT